jgi:hypothetical protein
MPSYLVAANTSPTIVGTSLLRTMRQEAGASSGGSSAPPGTLYLENGRIKSSLSGALPAGARVLAFETV